MAYATNGTRCSSGVSPFCPFWIDVIQRQPCRRGGGTLYHNIMPFPADPLALSASATARLVLVGVVATALWALVFWALAAA